MYNNSLNTFYKASIISFFAAIIVGGFSLMMGKENLFLLLNNDVGNVADFVFNYITYLGDGLALIPFVAWVVWKKRNQFLLTISSIIISTIIAQGIKRFILPIEPRPVEAIKNLSIIHTIPNVFVHTIGSFPSGHTTQVFTTFLLLCIFCNNVKILWIGFTVSLLVAYSRVYQAQHFPIDVAGGIIAALISVWCSVWINNGHKKRKWLTS
jgi:membrane-associated phospholipid phosphatase